MKRTLLITILFAGIALLFAFAGNNNKPRKVASTDPDTLALKMIYSEALENGAAYENLRKLCKEIPPRLSGSRGAKMAVDYMYQVMNGMGLDSVWLQECMVPHWERGVAETGNMIIDEQITRMNICALGGSDPTPSDGLEAEVIEVRDFDHLKELGEKKIKGKIVFYNYPFNETFISCFHAYGDAVKYRWQGPHMAQTYGAVAVLVRSMTNARDTFPHTGVMRMDSLRATIPSAAISTIDAEILSKSLKGKSPVRFSMTMNCHMYADEKSHNVIGEIRGSEHPEKVIVFGGHLDAWDNGEGAHDDGAGCVQGIEVLRLFKTLGIKPRYTIRCVLWMNEENGGKGAAAYFDYARKNKVEHIAAIESDAGGFTPRGFGLDMKPAQRQKIQTWQPLFFPYGVYDFTQDGGGADIGPLKELGTPLLGLHPDSQRYFDHHHTENDKFEHVNRRELHLGAASIAGLVYMIDKYGL
jgi:hypothetical protein